ncbi:concanavalin A-like lectin/glucanase domain-containing protein [Gautieria morchelliformis]|nr:concanavalin A-like lectin/glucanase domain-containing protein [Gautieria morchelliformis]
MARVPLVLAILTAVSFARGYSLSRTYRGIDFINGFNFWDGAVTQDPTGSSSQPSAAHYMPKDPAQKQGLVWVNDKGHFGISVDSTFTYSGDGRRPSARITSKEAFHHGLFILDAVHLPYGEATWPAFWMNGADGHWPTSGELDIIEGVGSGTKNSVSYHTGPGCRYDQGNAQSGIFNAARGIDCYALANNNEACGNVDPSTTSYGSGASNVGGGVWAVEWTSEYIKTWHFDRSNIPKDITTRHPVPQRWGTPVTHLSSKQCNIDQAYGPQSIIFNIELCGTWAGSAFNGGPQACVKYVQNNPNAFKNAYFEINSLNYYQ